MELLILLASREGQLVTRSEIADRLWASEVFVDTEHGINTAIRKLRYLLRDDPDNPKFIQTVIGMGYRFIAPITAVQKPSSEAVRPGAASLRWIRSNQKKRFRQRRLLAPQLCPHRIPAIRPGLALQPWPPYSLPSLSLPFARTPWVNACSIATRNPSSPPWLCFPSTTYPEIPLRTTSPMA